MRAFRVTILSALLLEVFATAPLSAQENEKPLSKLINEVGVNEQLYDNLEVKVREYYKTFHKSEKGSEPQFAEIESSEYAIWSVVQNGRFRAELTGKSQQFDGKAVPVTAIGMFDGTRTRMLDGNMRAVNEIEGRKKDKHLVSPHMLLLSDMGSGCKGVPLLSTYLNESRVYDDEDCRWTSGIAAAVSIAGTEQVLGHECTKVRVRLTHKGEDAAIWDLWLSAANNYIPLKFEGFTPGINKRIPHSVGVVDEIKEHSPGIWFPYTSTVTAFDAVDLEKGIQTKRWERKYIVETVSLTPSYPLEFFRHLEIPDGAAVYQVRDNKIVGGLRKGTPSDPTAKATGTRSWAAFILLNVLVAATILALVLFRRRPNSSKPTKTT